MAAHRIAEQCYAPLSRETLEDDMTSQLVRSPMLGVTEHCIALLYAAGPCVAVVTEWLSTVNHHVNGKQTRVASVV